MILDDLTRLILAHNRARKDVEEFLRALFAAAYGRDNRHADRIFEFMNVNMNAAAFRLILHIEVNEKRNAFLEELNRQEEVTLDVRAVNDVHDQVNFVIHQVVDNDLFLRGACVDAVRTRQVDDRNCAVLISRIAYFFIDRDTRPVTDLLTGTCQLVEDRGLTSVRVARQGY